jgi:polyhydroxybutyrate depolymerase
MARSRLRTGRLQTVQITVGGLSRTYLVYAPSADSARHPLPLVLVYHGADDTAANTTTETGLLAMAEKRQDMIVAFLQGVDETWNDDAGEPPAERMDVNDVAFTQAVLRQLEQAYHVDMARVVATGFSNGAILAELLGCRIAADITLIVPVEGQLGSRFAGSCQPAKPISVYEIHATGDQAIPYSGGVFDGVGGQVRVLSAPASAAHWAGIDHCGAPAQERSGASILTDYRSCDAGVSVTLDSIQGGSHEWPPGFAQLLAGVIGSAGDTRTAVVPAR